jgi:hypothetical protein
MQPSTYEVVQVRYDSSKTVANESFYCDFRVQRLNLHKNWRISSLLAAKNEILYIRIIGHLGHAA